MREKGLNHDDCSEIFDFTDLVKRRLDRDGNPAERGLDRDDSSRVQILPIHLKGVGP